MREIMRNSITAGLQERVRFQKKKSELFENLNAADIISMPMFATCKGKMERIILFMRNGESAFLFRRRVHSEVV